MNGIEKTIGFECPICKGGQQSERIYIPVDFEGNAITCPTCNNRVEISPTWRAQLNLFRYITKSL